MVIPQNKIEEVKSANDIVDIISSYIPLVKRGKDYKARCPFHDEKTPSFTVSQNKQMFYCFGCHVGGTVFTFVQQYEKISFIDAVMKLAERANIYLPLTDEDDDKDREIESLYNINANIMNYYHDNLINSEQGKIGLDYFIKREIKKETIEKFKLGFALNSWDSLVDFSERKKINFVLLEKLGLIGKKANGDYYDHFRGRIIFPILNQSGKASGFGARKLFEDDSGGKYINSKDSQIYNKSKILYGLFNAYDSIRKNESAILVEGYMDFLMLYQNGFQNVISTSGTALTIDQLKLLSRYTKNILFLYDSDLAGLKASVRGLDLILEQGFYVNIVELDEGEDPDSFLKKNGPDKLKNRLEHPISFIEFIAKVYLKLGKLSTTKDRTETTRNIITLITKVKDGLMRDYYLKEISDKFNLYESVVRDEYENQIKKSRVKTERQVKSEKQFPTVENTKLNIPKFVKPSIEEEDFIILCIIEGRHVYEDVFQYIDPGDIKNPIVNEILQRLKELFDQKSLVVLNDIIDYFDDPQVQGYLSQLIMNKRILDKNEISKEYNIDYDKWVKDVEKKFLIKKVKKLLIDLNNQIKEAEAQKLDSEYLLQLLEKQKELSDKEHKIRTSSW